MSGAFMAFTWGLSLLCAVLVTSILKANKLLGIILGVIFAQGLMFVAVHMFGWTAGPVVNMGGTYTPILMDIVFAVIGALIGALIARAIRRGS